MTNIAENQISATSQQPNTSIGISNLTNRNAVQTNNENSPPKIVDYYIKRPKTCNLLDVSNTYYPYIEFKNSNLVILHATKKGKININNSKYSPFFFAEL